MFFGGDVTICMYSPSPHSSLFHFFLLILGSPSSYLRNVIFE